MTFRDMVRTVLCTNLKDIKSSVLYGTPGQGTRHHKLTRIKTQEEGVFVMLGGRRLEVMARMFFSCLDGTFFRISSTVELMVIPTGGVSGLPAYPHTHTRSNYRVK